MELLLCDISEVELNVHNTFSSTSVPVPKCPGPILKRVQGVTLFCFHSQQDEQVNALAQELAVHLGLKNRKPYVGMKVSKKILVFRFCSMKNAKK